MTTEEGNKLIMVFDGWRLETRYTFDPDHNGGKNEYQVYVKDTPMGTVTCRPENVAFDIVYHQSWDALMSVVEKIEKDLVNESTITHHRFEGTYWCEFIDSEETQTGYAKSEKSKIEAVWLCVIDFIQWYNSQPKS